MPPVSLRFVSTVSAPYPISTTGAGTAMAAIMRQGDPCIAFLTQVQNSDTIHFLTRSTLSVTDAISTPPGRSNCTGMGYDPQSGSLIMAFPFTGTGGEEIVAINPVNGTERTSIAAPIPEHEFAPGVTTEYSPQGLATNGLLIARANDLLITTGHASVVEMFTRTGIHVGTGERSGRRIRGITSSPWSWAYVDQASHEIIVTGPFGNTLAVCPGVGSPGDASNSADPGGMAAIAFDMPWHPHMDTEPQEWLPGGVLGAAGTINHPDTDWTPEPWGGRHKLFIANESDQTIYGGYLTLA